MRPGPRPTLLSAMPRRRKPGRPQGTTRGGSRIVQFRVSDAEYAALAAEGNPNAVAKARALRLEETER
jgi:hypothetical protein